MAKEIKILIPDSIDEETIDIRVSTNGKELLNYKLEVLDYNKRKTDLSRADFVKKKIDSYSKEYTLVEIGLDNDHLIPVLFRSSVNHL